MFDTNDTIKMLYSDTSIPDIFINEYMPSLNDNQVKIYIYCCFLNKNKKPLNEMVLSNVFKIPQEDLSELLYTLIESGLIAKKNTGFFITDLKEVEINKLYKLRTAPAQNEMGTKKDIISSINTKFFQGVMAISWYTTIETLFKLYKFDDDVMFSLFSDCFERGILKKAYLEKVAKNWSENGIKTNIDLEKYFNEYKAFKDISTQVAKKLNRKSPLTQYEEKYVEKWTKTYGYSFDIIELALKNTTKINNPNLEYVHKILTTWYKNGLKTKSQIVKANKVFYEKKNNTYKGKSTDIKNYYNYIRNQNNLALKVRKSELYEKITNFKALEEEETDLSIQALSSSGDHKKTILNKINDIEFTKTTLLKENGFDDHYLDPIYTCLECKDTGILPDGTVCQCRKDIPKSQ